MGVRDPGASLRAGPSARAEQVSFPAVSHYALGLPRPTCAQDSPDAAERIRAARQRLGARGLEVALQRDPTMRERLGETGLRALLRDTDVYLERVARAVASGRSRPSRRVGRLGGPRLPAPEGPDGRSRDARRGAPKCARRPILAPEEQVLADEALDESIVTFRRYRRIAGDARKQNAILTAIYKGG